MSMQEATTERRSIKVNVSKAKEALEMYVDDIPEPMFIEMVRLGAEAMVNKGLTKVVVKGLEGAELEAARAKALEIAQENVQKILAGTFKTSGSRASSSKVPGKVMTEARRLAKAQIKAEIKLAGFKISHIPAKQITELANQYLTTEDGAALIKQAAENIEAIEQKAQKGALDVAKIKVDPKMVAADAKRTAERQAKAEVTKKTKARTQPTA